MLDKKTQILDRLLQNAGFEGWNNAALENATATAGYDRKYAYICFPHGIEDATKELAISFDEQMLKSLHNQDLSKLKIRERIAAIVIARLEIYNKHKESIRKLVAYYSLPQNAGRAVSNLAHTVNQMWYAAGDNSTDYNWYTKRFLLSGVYTSTLLYWLNDDSKDFQSTREFLSRRIENVMQIQKAKSKLQELVKKIV